MKRLFAAWGMLAISFLFPAIAAAQGTGRLNGEIMDKDGTPWADLTVEIKNPDTGQTLTVKTDKNGRFVQLGLRSGIYTITLLSPKDNISFPSRFQIADGQENDFKLNYKDELAKNAAAHPDALKAREEEENKFKMMKTHFAAGIAALTDSNEISKQLKTAPADQKSALQQKKTADCQTAVTEFQQAEQGVGPKEVNNHALVWGNLGQAEECAGHFDEAAKAFQNAVALKPQPNYYTGLSTNIAKASIAAKDPKAIEAQAAEASAGCEKSAAADPVEGERCWKNLGIVYYSASMMKQAVPPLQKAAGLDPKDADAWFLLGNALTGTIDSKQEGDKIIYIVPPGTVDAYKKYLELAPNGPHAAEAQANIQGLAQYQQAEETKIVKKKKS
jgi:tetratricopeptide (TPR) repeat protein